MAARSTPSLGSVYPVRMCLTRLRAFAWVLALVLLTGLAAPVFASVPASSPSHGRPSHSHAGLSDGHAHAGNVVAGVHDDCLTEADCILGHLGLALPSVASIGLPPATRASYGPAGSSGQAGRSPDRAMDPPRHLTLR